MTLADQDVPVIAWNEPDGLLSRGTVVVSWPRRAARALRTARCAYQNLSEVRFICAKPSAAGKAADASGNQRTELGGET